MPSNSTPKPEKSQARIGYENNSSQKLSGLSFVTVSPAAVYLDSLAPGSRRSMREALARVAGLAVCGHKNSDRNGDQNFCDHDRNGNPLVDPAGFPWWALTREDVVAIRAALAESATRPQLRTRRWPPCAACCAKPGGSV